ncbi:MAG TPA: CPBP family intramembrane glutamic endopeptidase [Longimicrobium sp.]|jgi:membrane protease YdiL (CAAX protease family)
MISAILSSFLQVLLFTAIPFAAYLATRRRARGFWEYVGLVRPERRTLALAAGLALVLAAAMLAVFSAPAFRGMLSAPNTVTGKLMAQGITGETAVLILLYAGIQTSLSEEILFRGFLAKRLIARMGFRWGNLLQALLFGSVHLLLFVGPAGPALTAARLVTLLAATSAIGWLLGWLNERRGNGSILPSWLAHALMNLITYSALALWWR